MTSGRPLVRVELVARPNYGIGGCDHRVFRDYIKLTSREGPYTSFYVYTDLDPQALLEGRPVPLERSAYLALSYHEKIQAFNPDRVYLEYERTKSYWLSWVYRTRVPPRYRDLTLRSAITLKLLMYQKTGAILAAVTTSLPEIVGKDRNWDYRFCWIRDASMILDLYARMGHVRSSSRYINFILNRMLLKNENMAVLYGINGEQESEERVLDHLAGYEGSRPVRIGNAAYSQRQNDLLETYYSWHSDEAINGGFPAL